MDSLIQIVLGDSVEADQVLTNDVDINYSSLDGIDANERTGVDGDPLNTYFATDSVDLLRNTLIPQSFGLNENKVLVGGQSAGYKDFYLLVDRFTPKDNSADPCGLISITFPPKIRSKASPLTVNLGRNPLV